MVAEKTAKNLRGLLFCRTLYRKWTESFVFRTVRLWFY